MNSLNKVWVIGNLTRDLGADERSFTYTAGGTACAKVSIAVNRSRKGADGNWIDEVSFFDVTIWGKTAENLKQYLVKGKQIAVVGHLKQDRWEKDGQKFSKVSIVAEEVQLLGGKGDGDQGGSQGKSNFTPWTNPPAQEQGFADESGFPEDIPF